MTAVAPDVELSVYGSGSFKTGVAIGDAGYSDEKGYTRLMLSGAQSEMSFHDRNEVACKADKRWNLYASEKKLRTHRPGGKGGFVISEDMTRFLQVSHAILSPLVVTPIFVRDSASVWPLPARGCCALSTTQHIILILRIRIAGSQHWRHYRNENPHFAGCWASQV